MEGKRAGVGWGKRLQGETRYGGKKQWGFEVTEGAEGVEVQAAAEHVVEGKDSQE